MPSNLIGSNPWQVKKGSSLKLTNGIYPVNQNDHYPLAYESASEEMKEPPHDRLY